MGKRRIQRPFCFLLLSVCLCFLLSGTVFVTGCGSSKPEEEKIRDLEFIVALPEEIPAELQQIIAQKEKEVFRLTYSSGSALYIACGYGEQKGGGYSISVPELYLTENAMVIKTELIGAGKEERAGQETSYPYIVVKTEWIDCPVVFQ